MVALLAGPVAAQDGDLRECPAPLVSGEWRMTQISTLTLVDIYSAYGSGTLPVVSGGSTDTGHVSFESCDDNGFILSGRTPDGHPLKFEMSLVDWKRELVRTEGEGEDAREVTVGYAPFYRGSMRINDMMQIHMDVTVRQPTEAISAMTIAMETGNSAAQGTPLAIMESLAGPSKRYECRCLEHLQNWIEEEVAEATLLRDAFAEPRYRQRPAGVPPDRPGIKANWTTQVYDDIIYTMVGEDISYDEAVQRVVEKRWPTGDDADAMDPSEPAGEETNTASEARTDMGGCVTEYGDAHLDSCYPTLDWEATDIHEGVHRATCRARRAALSPVMSVSEHADDEVAGYQAGIDYLQNFIDNECR